MKNQAAYLLLKANVPIPLSALRQAFLLTLKAATASVVIKTRLFASELIGLLLVVVRPSVTGLAVTTS